MASSEPRPGRCGAKIRGKPGQYCEQYPVTGRTRCRNHGGKTPRGIALPQTKHGRYSKDLPSRLAQDYGSTAEDPEILSIRAEIALVHTRLLDVLRRVDTGESSRLWRQLREIFTELESAQRRKDSEAAGQLLNELGRTICQGHMDYAAWDEVMKQVDRKVRLQEAEARRQEKMRQMITRDQGMLLATPGS